MVIFVGYLVGGLIVLSLLALLAFAVAAMVVVKSTVEADRADQDLRADLDRVLAEILATTPSNPNIS